MEEGEDASSQLFNVVYDPRFDRFFLEEDALHRERNGSLERQAISVPWDKWLLPPKSVAGQGKSEAPRTQQGSGEGAEGTCAQVPIASSGEQPALVPALDFSSFQQPLADVLAEEATGTPAAQHTRKKARVQDYTVHFKRASQDADKVIGVRVANAAPNDEHQVKWNGEVLRVQFPGLRPASEESVAPVHGDALEHERLRGARQEQWPGSPYELRHLMRIRAHADGLRNVNSACRFVALSSSESSDSDEEPDIPQGHESDREGDLLPVFFRDDRVLFHAKRRWLKGTVRRRIPSSEFYAIRADNGSLFDAVLAAKMELLDEEVLPSYHFRSGDRVLWAPDSNGAATRPSRTTTSKSTRRRRERSTPDDELTYKAKIVQERSLNRFDLLLRTGRVVKKVPYEQLRPRDASEFVSTTTSRRR
jgi:hypothetical protein